MRTVTFSDKAVAKYVNENYVSTWINREPKFHDCSPATETHIARYSGEAYATKNFCTFFVTPELDVLHYASGYYRPAWFKMEAEFALAARVDAYDDEFKPKRDCGARVAKLHDLHAKDHKDQYGRVMATKPSSAEGNDAEATQRLVGNRESLCEALNYLHNLHKDLGKAHASGKPKKLADVIKNYKYGNEFTEEGRRGGNWNE
jgi:hypothetical protein